MSDIDSTSSTSGKVRIDVGEDSNPMKIVVDMLLDVKDSLTKLSDTVVSTKMDILQLQQGQQNLSFRLNTIEESRSSKASSVASSPKFPPTINVKAPVPSTPINFLRTIKQEVKDTPKGNSAAKLDDNLSDNSNDPESADSSDSDVVFVPAAKDLDKTPKIEKSNVFRMLMESEPKSRSNSSRPSRSVPSNMSGKNVLQIYQNQASYEHIRLDDLTIPRVETFMRNVHNYESLYGFDLPIPALISEVVAMRIVSYFKRDHPDFTSLNDATTIDIFKMILTIVQPADKNLFYKYMDKYVEFPTLPRSYVATVSNFKLMYEALLLYRLNFTNTFDVCSLMNKSSCIPNIDNKEGGLIKLFLSKIPFKWGINTYNSWTRPKFTALQDFIMKFYFAVERENKMSLSVRASQAKFELSAKVFTPTNAVHQITTSQVIKSSGITKTDQDFEEDSADNLEQDIEDEMAKVGFVDDDDNLEE